MAAQNINFSSATTIEYSYTKLGAVKGIAGIIGDNYYILESDYGGKFDFNNNIRTIVTRFSISEGKFKGRFNLNELVANTRKEMNQILFCDVIAWKDKIIGFYTYKKGGGKKFSASAAIFDATGKIIKAGIDIGDFEHEYVSSSFFWQGGLLINGRNTLSVINDFQYRMTPDSSRIIVLCPTGKEEKGNIKFKVYDNDLELRSEIVTTIPLKDKTGDLIDFALDNKGYLCVLTKTPKPKSEREKNEDENYFELHTINTFDNNKISTVLLNIYGKAINTASIVLKNDNQLYCFGNYYDADDKKTRDNTTGVFSVWLNPEVKGSIVKSSYTLPESVGESLKYTSGPSNKNGIGESFRYYEAIPDNEGGMYVVMASEALITFVQGRTGALNKYREITRCMLITRINKDKKIKWSSGVLDLSSNPEWMTRTDRCLFFVNNHQLYYAFVSSGMISKETSSLYHRIFNNENGISRINTKIIGTVPSNYMGYKTVEKTILPLGNNEYILTMVGGQLGFFKFKMD